MLHFRRTQLATLALCITAAAACSNQSEPASTTTAGAQTAGTGAAGMGTSGAIDPAASAGTQGS